MAKQTTLKPLFGGCSCLQAIEPDLVCRYGSAVTDLSAIQYFSRLQKLNLSNLRQAQAFEKSRVFGRFPASIRVLILAFSDVRTRNLEAMQLSQLHHLALNFCTKLHWPSLRKLLPQMISLKVTVMPWGLSGLTASVAL